MEIIGWSGAIGLLAAYYLLSNGKLSVQKIAYHFITFLCSVALGVNAYYNAVYPFVLVNAIWIVLSINTMVRLKAKIS